jgi:putative membrane protein
MSNVFLVIGVIFGAIAALLHVVIFSFESINWTKPATWKRFGVASQADAETLKPMALNQGFYNLFLAIGAAIGLILLAVPSGPSVHAAGFALAFLALGSMLAASLVLVISNPSLLRAAVTQGAAPLVAVLALVIAAVSA